MKDKKLALGPDGQVRSLDPAPLNFQDQPFPSESSQIPFDCQESDNGLHHGQASGPQGFEEKVDEDYFYGSSDGLVIFED